MDFGIFLAGLITGLIAGYIFRKGVEKTEPHD
jgi:hypothetical protein